MASFESESPTLHFEEGSISDTQSRTDGQSSTRTRFSTSTKIETHAQQCSYKSILSRYGVIEVIDWESDELLQPICNTVLINQGALASFANVIKMALFTNEGLPLNLHNPDLYGWNTSPRLAQFIRIVQEAWHKMATARLEYSDEPSFGKIHLPVMEELFESRSIAVSPTALQMQCQTANSTLFSLQSQEAIAVRPDFLVGLNKAQLQVRKDRLSDAITADLDSYVSTRDCEVLFNLSQILGQSAWFPFIFAEETCGRGGLNKARLQGMTAMLIALKSHILLHDRALEADPSACMAPTSAIFSNYGIRMIADMWELCLGQWDGSKFRVTTVWSGDVLKPQCLLEISSLLQDIQKEAQGRQELIGNWLYCLRNCTKATAGPNPKKKRTSTGRSQSSTSSASSNAPDKSVKPATPKRISQLSRQPFASSNATVLAWRSGVV